MVKPKDIYHSAGQMQAALENQHMSPSPLEFAVEGPIRPDRWTHNDGSGLARFGPNKITCKPF
ncbi:hypothetical protein Tsubulata_024114 [Turnera subulata]|uniref:Uncharacterized protein n=1 Tax=Turnera subulata TaxID=218843 RepID=A0A9Q0FER3_9ROSI|nr:hypothetical protein Tsubulata_024114 [Turnera subulata]